MKTTSNRAALRRKIACCVTIAKALTRTTGAPHRVIVTPDHEALVLDYLEFAPHGSRCVVTFHPRLIRQR